METKPPASPTLRLNQDVEMPQLGLGVFQATPEETEAAVLAAIREGYRLIDTARIYDNEEAVGRGLEAARAEGVARDEIFVVTKLWITDYPYERALVAFEESRARLGVEVVDLYLVHWPTPNDGDAIYGAWRAAETLLADGRARAIGVCNHTPELLDRLLGRARVVPAVNQIELHPYFSQAETRAADAAHGIVTQSWSPIGGSSGSGGRRGAASGRKLLAEPLLAGLGEKYGRTPAQLVLRWHVEHGLAPIPKSVRPDRIAENFRIFDFELDEDDRAAIDALETGVRGGPDPYRIDLARVTGG
jgi:diketogulonate reductase-like aldo/keto reductase